MCGVHDDDDGTRIERRARACLSSFPSSSLPSLACDQDKGSLEEEGVATTQACVCVRWGLVHTQQCLHDTHTHTHTQLSGGVIIHSIAAAAPGSRV